ncbi:MAG: hypothetical protein ACLTJG_03320 [[Clostridium] innocuum]
MQYEYCPIAEGKQRYTMEASRQEDTLYDAAKYRTTADTKKAESGVFEEKKSASMTEQGAPL